VSRIGLIAGSGRFPIYFLQAARKNGYEVYAAAIKDEASPKVFELASHATSIYVGDFQKVIDFFVDAGVKQIIMAGRIPKTVMFESLKPDERLAEFLQKLPAQNDNVLLGAFISEFRKEGIEVCDSTTFLSFLLPEKGTLTKREPNEREWADINFGFDIAKQIAGMDIGQTVVIKDRVVVAVEAIEGTDAAILRGGELGQGNITVVKVARPRQDKRYDMPTVGVDTVEYLKKAGATCLAFENKMTLLLDKDEVVRLADEAGIAIVVI